MNFKLNPYYSTNLVYKEGQIQQALELVELLGASFKSNSLDEDKFPLIGVGNDAGGKVYGLADTGFCLKIARLGKHVGKNQEQQFELSVKCEEAIAGKQVDIEGKSYVLTTIHAIAVAADEDYAYILMPQLNKVIRLWDEEKTPFHDKDNWPAIREIKAAIREYGQKSGVGAETFYAQMDVNGNNLLVDVENKLIYLIDPYVPESLKSEYELLIDKFLLDSWLCEPLLALSKLELPSWYVGAGTVAQTVWNHLHGFEGTFGIGDIDFVYYDAEDLSAEAESGMADKIKPIFAETGISVDVINEARVHLWYEEEFGVKLEQYDSLESAISTWPTTASAIGVRMHPNKEYELQVYAPFGLSDLMELIVRPNKKLVSQAVYEAKAKKWKQKWPKLQVMPW